MEVDIEKSKIKKKVCLKEPLFNRLIEAIVLNLFATMPIFIVTMEVLNADYSFKSLEWIFMVLAVLVSVVMFFRINRINKLKTVIGRGTKANRKLVNQLIGQIGLSKTVDKTSYIIAETPVQLTSWGHVAIFIFHEGNVLTNIYTKGLGGTKSPFHFMSESNIWRSIKLKFKQAQNQ